ncbi:molybdate ABC transporter substrate-binding protein [Faecalibacterium sp. OF04-11AC]|uniref:molybdate ABC transporter substrate-binding protein n=1 Tax=Faecalibacterium sp. OF04-11AC TaxID=2293109 RepID=UPI000E8E0FB9|nr:molybdate ABC transporter substrate-binding protein [Faecalibacterium sp. OF04-11AC]RGF72343.1 molybdate ABC transporter substrate-binding protein [Faecalibacterium sp. OF04-11AC]
MKRRTLILGSLALSASLLLNACGGTAASSQDSSAPASSAAASSEASGESVQLTVFAAASLTETLNEISEQYKTVAPNVELVFNFDSSGTLKTQIEEGADCDLFLSAAQKQMNALEEENLINTGTRVDLLENKVVLAVPEGNPADIQSFEDIGTDPCKRIALGNEDVPVGSYSVEILTNLGILDELESSNKITYGSNVKEVTTQVKEAAADCGIVYATDAYSAGLETVDEATADECRQVIYPAALTASTAHAEEAQAFLEYLTTDDAAAIFESVGFAMVK